MTKTKTITLLLILSLPFLSGCDLIEDTKWLFGLVDYGRIEGIVTNSEGTPIENIRISCSESIFDFDEGTWEESEVIYYDEEVFGGTVCTNINGEYRNYGKFRF